MKGWGRVSVSVSVRSSSLLLLLHSFYFILAGFGERVRVYFSFVEVHEPYDVASDEGGATHGEMGELFVILIRQRDV